MISVFFVHIVFLWWVEMTGVVGTEGKIEEEIGRGMHGASSELVVWQLNVFILVPFCRYSQRYTQPFTTTATDSYFYLISRVSRSGVPQVYHYVLLWLLSLGTLIIVRRASRVLSVAHTLLKWVLVLSVQLCGVFRDWVQQVLSGSFISHELEGRVCSEIYHTEVLRKIF